MVALCFILGLSLAQLSAQVTEVMIRPSTTDSEQNVLSIMEGLGAQYLRQNQSGTQLWQVSQSEVSMICDYLHTCHPTFKVAPNYPLFLSKIPNDSLFLKQWSLHNNGSFNGCTDQVDIGASLAWDLLSGGKKILIAIIDGGMDLNHPDLLPNLWQNPDETPGDTIDNDMNGKRNDLHGWDFLNNDSTLEDVDNGHGTHVAGIVGARGDNSTGIAGLCWNCELMPLKFTDSTGKGSTFHAIEAIDYAIEMGADIINASWGGAPYDPMLYDAIQRANDVGIIFIAAAGNNNENNNDLSPFYPASYDLPNIISVGATNCHDQLIPSSNVGMNSVDIMAPGLQIWSALPGGEYGSLSGTSMAAPHVAGAVALLLQQDSTMTPYEIKDRLIRSADPIPELTGKCVANGRLNIYKALINRYGSSFNKSYTFKGISPSTITSTDMIIGEDGSIYQVGQVWLSSPERWNYYLQKSDPMGNLIWAKSIGWDTTLMAVNDIGIGVIEDQNNHIILSGYSHPLGDSMLNDRYSISIVKIDTTGEIISANGYGMVDSVAPFYNKEFAKQILPLQGGDYLIIGSTDKDGNTALRKSFLIKTSPNGDLLQDWVFYKDSLNDSFPITFTEILQPEPLNMVVSGYVIEGGLFQISNFVASIDSTNSLTWINRYQRDNYVTILEGGTVASDGTMWFIGMEYPDTTISTNPISEIFQDPLAGPILVNLNSDGEVLQALKFKNKGASSTFFNTFSSIDAIDDGILITANNESSTDGSKFIMRLNGAGELLWAKEYEFPYSIINYLETETNESGGYILGFNYDSTIHIVRTDEYGYSPCIGKPFSLTIDSVFTLNSTPYTLQFSSGLFDRRNIIDSLLTQTLTDSIQQVTLCASLDTCEIINRFKVVSNVVCLNDSIDFENLSKGGTSYSWLIDDSIVGTGYDMRYSFDSAGYYTIRLQVQNDSCLLESSQIIHVRRRGIADIGPDTTTNAGAYLLNGADENAANYYWINFTGDTLGRDSIFAAIESGLYILTIEDVCGFTDSDAANIILSGNGQYVLPGDVNVDGYVNLVDWLLLGLKNGKTGPGRTGASSSFQPQKSIPWKDSLPDTDLGRHQDLMNADCDGNGIVEIASDQNAIKLNQNSSHPSSTDELSPISFRFATTQPEVPLFEEIELSFYLEGDPSILNQVYGISYSIHLGLPLTTLPEIDATNSWLGQEGLDLAKIVTFKPQSQRIDFGITRTDQLTQPVQPGNNLLGQGIIIAIADDINDPWLFAQKIPLTLTLGNVLVVSEAGESIPVRIATSQSTETILITIPDSIFIAEPRYFCHFTHNNQDEISWRFVEKNVLSYKLMKRTGIVADTIAVVEGGNSIKTIDSTYSVKSTYDPMASYELLVIGKDTTMLIQGWRNCEKASLSEGFESNKLIEISNIFPNPARNEINIPIHSLQSTQLSFEIIDLHGRVLIEFEERIVKGPQTFTRSLPSFASGLYLVICKEQNRIISRQRLMIR